MTSAELSALLVLATVSSFTPGPNTTLSTAMAANHGLRHALRFVCAVPVGWGLLGRVLDGLGRPMDADQLGPVKADKFYPVMAPAPDPLTRRLIAIALPPIQTADQFAYLKAERQQFQRSLG